MTLPVALTHRTTYRYDRPITLGPQVMRLRPAPHCRTPISAYSLTISPQHLINWQQDPFGNFQARLLIPEPTKEFTTTVDLVADLTPINPFDFFIEEAANNWPFAYQSELAKELGPYLEAETEDAALTGYVRSLDTRPAGTIDFVCNLNRKLSSDIAYRTRMEAGVQTPAETLSMRSGSCRDSGWLLVQILRRLGLASRFVSGYLIQLAPRETCSGTQTDSADLHAWAEVFIPGAGWIGLDPTSGLVAGEGHVPLAATPSPGNAAPITGTHEPAQVDFSFSMRVQRLSDQARGTERGDEIAWQALLAAGTVVEAKLRAGDVRLSIGGEPTFVAEGAADTPEWTIAALGPTKRGYADTLARRLLQRFAPGGLLHHGHGKWYPGEPEARWACSIYWRRDGTPLWRDTNLIADESRRSATLAEADAFARALCQSLGLPAESALSAYEDSAHFKLVEQKLPPEAVAEDPGSSASLDRELLARALARGLDQPIAFILPLLMTRASGGGRQFITEQWSVRRERLFLVPGGSPAGLRLPLTALCEISFVDYPHVLPVDPFADRRVMGVSSPNLAYQQRQAAAGEPQHVRTALAVELRDGQVCVFLPPLENGDDYVTLIAAIEAAAASAKLPIRLEGYAPPFDPGIAFIKITPDPGVLEINVHPAATWDEAVEITSSVYEEAHTIGLVAEKYALDGRRVGTGGGSHIVVGGLSPADSPFLRRPDLLGSVITYWQNHPSLSYLFSGQFIGPTSQAPRIDEARHEALYEMELALSQLQPRGQSVAPWLVDRLFRNLLVDATGNTHRAEICIDKLYAPDGPMGRLGLVEFRAFEMPPSARMSLAQQLLVRALIAWFWEQPYRRPLIRWGTALHDRFMLPAFLWSDLQAVIADLRSAGMPLEAQWFEPHLEFRFPIWGAVERAGVRVEIRHALEPWLVLGEHNEPGSTSRPVDSSLERVQARVSGSTGDRYAVACNGFALPLTPTGVAGERVAGIRFRAWKTSTGLHPNIPVHAPLTFEVVDTWAGRSVGGCRCHVTHPGGRHYQTAPINAREGEGRRSALFETDGHSPGPFMLKAALNSPEFPLTLDLRRSGPT
jgi:uncharacterized protein (DUF2126 family)/transglutaminase-like putative cysteine protease